MGRLPDLLANILFNKSFDTSCVSVEMHRVLHLTDECCPKIIKSLFMFEASAFLHFVSLHLLLLFQICVMNSPLLIL